MPSDSVMPYAMMIRSGRRSDRPSDAPATAASAPRPGGSTRCSTRSRASTSGRSAMRCSIVGVAVNLVTRWRSIRSTMRAASNFSITTSRSPASMLCSVGEGVDVVHRREHEDRLRPRDRHPSSAIGVLNAGLTDRRRRAQDDLGGAGRAAAADPLQVRGDQVGQLRRPSTIGRIDPVEILGTQIDGGIDHLLQPLQFPRRGPSTGPVRGRRPISRRRAR